MMENQLSELTWHEMGARRPQSQELLRRLMGLGLSPDICRQLVDRVEDADDLDQAWRKALYFLASDLPVHGEDLLVQGRRRPSPLSRLKRAKKTLRLSRNWERGVIRPKAPRQRCSG